MGEHDAKAEGIQVFQLIQSVFSGKDVNPASDDDKAPRLPVEGGGRKARGFEHLVHPARRFVFEHAQVGEREPLRVLGTSCQLSFRVAEGHDDDELLVASCLRRAREGGPCEEAAGKAERHHVEGELLPDIAGVHVRAVSGFGVDQQIVGRGHAEQTPLYVAAGQVFADADLGFYAGNERLCFFVEQSDLLECLRIDRLFFIFFD